MPVLRRGGVAVLALSLAVAAGAFANQASKLYKDGRKAEKAGDIAQAYLLYSRAAGLAPGKPSYWLKSQALRSRAALLSKVTIPAGSVLEDPDEPDVAESIDVTEKDLREGRKPQPPRELKAFPVRKTFNLRGNANSLFEQVAKEYGLDVVFDGDFPPGGVLNFRIDQANYREALYALETLTSSFIFPLGDRLFMVVKDTQQKRTEVEPTVTVVIPIPQTVTVQEAQELARSVQQVMEIKRFGIDSLRRLVLLNDRISKVRPAQEIFEDLLLYRPEVSIDLEFLEFNRNDALDFGLTLPTNFPLVNLSTFFHNVPTIPSGLSYLLKFGGGASVFGIGITDATLVASFNKSNARTLLRTTIRSVDGLPATFHVGDKYPILTAGYYGPPSFGGDTAYRPPPSFTFEDLGLSVKVTPRIHGMDDVSLDIDAEFKVLAGQSLNGIPIISNRKLTSKVRLKDGEWALVAGMMSSAEAHAIQGLAGISRIPGLGALLRQNNNSRDSSQVVIVVKPRVMSLPPSEALTRTIFVGTESRSLAPL